MTRVLFVDDEPSILRALRINLSAREYDVSTAVDGTSGLAAVARDRPDVIILDLGLPDRDGTEVIHGVRGWTSIPIIVLSAWGQESQEVAALDAGADDYLTKPFGVGELLARMRVALRHAARAAGEPDEPVFTTGDLRVDLEHRQVFLAEREVHLTPTEYKVLLALVRQAGKVLTHRYLLKEVWGASTVTQTPALRVHMAQLRHKLEKDPAQPRHLLTEPGVGYRLRVD
jgi:two-component system, OmpR family, KDP operon response regulator KdpE